MKRNINLKKLRVEFVKMAMNNPKKGAEKLRALADGLENTKSTADTVFALTQILGVSEKTIIRDFINDTIC